MKKLCLLLLLFAAPVAAQNSPGKFSTITTTSTSADSAHIGCAIGSSTCTGGIKAGPIAASTGTFTGALTATSGAFSLSSSVSNAVAGTALSFTIQNTTANATTQSVLYVGNNSSATRAQFAMYSTTTTPVGSLYLADGAYLDSAGVGGIAIGSTNGSGAIRFYTGGLNPRFGINAAGDWTVGSALRIMDSVGTPVISACGTSPTLTAGNDSGFTIVTGSTSTTSCTITFGHPFGVLPTCVSSGFATLVPSTTNIVLNYSAGTSYQIPVICRGS